eukprot:66967-Rhodomonas_salina.2
MHWGEGKREGRDGRSSQEKHPCRQAGMREARTRRQEWREGWMDGWREGGRAYVGEAAASDEDGPPSKPPAPRPHREKGSLMVVKGV